MAGWRRRLLLIPVAVLAAVPFLRDWLGPQKPDLEVVNAAYAEALTPPEGPMRVYHLGHSLVGRDMPAMLAQLVGDGHGHEVQLGWGTSLKHHWEEDLPINGFERENDHPRYRDAKEALASGDYDAVVLTEMVELRDAIKYHDSGTYLPKWAELAREGNPDARVYLYETWHPLDDPEGWLARLDKDLTRYWEDGVLLPDLAVNAPENPVRIIPAGQVMARFVRAVEAAGGVGNVTNREDLFARAEDGGLDPIHVNDLGAYLVALTHYAVLYHRSPVGLPHELRRADGSKADAPSAEAAALMQKIVWQVVTGDPKTGVAG
jgi:hypothetical protein